MGSNQAVSRAQAARICGDDFYDINRQQELLGGRCTEEQREVLSVIPFSAEVLKQYASTHILFVGFPFSVMDWFRHSPRALQGGVSASMRLFYSVADAERPWYKGYEFATTPVEVGWYLIRKTPILGSNHKLVEEQTDLLSGNEFVPPASVVTYATCLHYLATGLRLFAGNDWARCSDQTTGTARASIGGNSDELGLKIVGWYDAPLLHIGSASAVKPDVVVKKKL